MALKKGDFFAVESGRESKGNHNPDHPFWVVEVVDEPTIVAKTFSRVVDGGNEIFREGDFVVGVRHWERNRNNALVFSMDAATIGEPQPVNCYLCMAKDFDFQVAFKRDNPQLGLLLIGQEVDKMLTRLVKNRLARELKRADANKENIPPTGCQARSNRNG